MNAGRITDAAWFPGVSLGVVMLVTTAVLALGHGLTSGRIAQAEADDMRQQLEQILPDGYADNNLLTDTVTLPGPDGTPRVIHQAKKDGVVRAVLFEAVAPNGYSGRIVMMMAVDAEGRVIGVRVIKHNETPGLGDKIEAARNDWIFGFNGKSLRDPEPARWAVKKDGGVFDQFAGATITPRAVVGAVRKGLEFFAAHRADMLGTAQTAQGEAR